MAVQDSYKILMDVGDVLYGAQATATAINTAKLAFSQLSDVQNKFNAQGRLTAQTFKGIGLEGENLSLSLEKVKGKWTLVGGAASTAARDILRAKESLRIAELAAAGRSATRGIASGQAAVGIVGKTPLPAGGSSGELLAYNKALAGLQKFTQENVTSAARVQKVWTDVNNNVFSANPKYQALQGQLVKVKNAIADIGAETRKAKESSDNYFLSWRNIMRFFEARLLYNGVSDVVGAVKAGTARAIEFEQILGRITTLAPAMAGSYNEWGESIKRVANAFGVDAEDAAKSYYSALSNQIGNSIQEIESFTRTTSEFARVTGATAEQANNLFSSAINAFGKSAGEAQDIAAKFFKTIDLGRVTAAGLSGSFGRSAVAAATLGVKLEELQASLSTLSRQGVTDADAQTQTLNLFNKLIKPTDKLKELLQEWGYESGQALVANEGLIGVLRRLDKELQSNGVARLGELVNDIRALRGSFGLTGKGLQEYARDLELISNATEDYKRAVDLTADTMGFKLAKQINQVKIAFTDLGQGALSTFVTISEFVGGAVNGIKILIGTVITLGTRIYAAGVIATVFTTIGSAVMAVVAGVRSLSVATSVFAGMKSAVIGVGVAMRATAATAATFAAIATGGLSLAIGALASYLLLAESNAERAKRVYAEAQESSRETTRTVLDEITKLYDKLAGRIADAFKPGLDSIALTRRAYVRTLADIDGGFKALKKTLKSFEEDTFRNLDDKISDVTSSLSALKSESKSIEDAMKKAFTTDDLETFRDTLDDLSAGKKARSVEAKIRETIADAAKLAQQGLKATKQDEIIKFKEQSIAKLAIASELERDLKALSKESVRDKSAAEKEVEKYSKKNVQRAQEQINLEREIATLTNEKRANKGVLKDESREDANRRQELLASKLADKQDELNRHKAETKKANEELKVTTKDLYDYSKALVEFEEQKRVAMQGQLDINKSLAALDKDKLDKLKEKKVELEKVFSEISDLMTSKDTGLTSEGTIKKVEELRETYKGLVDTATNPQAFIELLQYTDKIVERAKTAKGLDDNGRQQAKYQAEMKESAERVNVLKGKDLSLTEKMRDTIDKAVSEAAGLPSSPLNLWGGAITQGGVQFAEQYALVKDEITAILAKVKETPDALASNAPKLRELINQLNILRSENASDAGTDATKGIENLVLVVNSLLRTQKDLNAVKIEQQELIRMQPVLTAALTNPLNAGAEAAKTLAQRMRESEKTIIDSADAMQRMRAVLDAEDKAPAAQVKTPAGGGLMHFAGGGRPYGSDKIPSLLSPGEFVVNAGASRKFYSQLVAMNSGSRNYAGGGNVSTTVGDIHVSMSSNGNASTDVVKLGRLLKREIRRGTVKL